VDELAVNWSPQAANISQLKGQRLGPYEIEEIIGRGGMAIVYKALQPALRRHVAIKVLPPQFAHEGGFLARFQREAETIARLEHPHILPIYDYGQEEGVPYIVTRLVTGGTLSDWLARSVTLERALLVFTRLLGALEYAHTRQPAVVHRDLKPSNVLMSDSDWPLLTDFGLAWIAEPSARLTRTGAIIGTPEYMAPEQSQRGTVDHRADLYAMGIMLFEILTGRLPYQGDMPLALIRQHVQAHIPSPCFFNPALSQIWDEVIRRALAKSVVRRYQSASEMEDAVQAAWQELRSTGDQAQVVGPVEPDRLYESASRALEQGNWQRVIGLCRAILATDPAHARAVALLTQAHEALRRESATEEPEAPAAAANGAPPPAVLTVRAGVEMGRTYPLDGSLLSIGRAASNHIQPRDASVSRRHCQIHWAHGAYVVEDLGASNGTCVNQVAVQAAELRSGDLIQIGDLVLEFRLTADAP
jgi:serine/threonine-protein kinase